MLEKNIEKIDESDLNSLIDNEVSEGKTIEYKQSLPSDSKEDKIKFLSGISSFANANGGDYLVGIVERKGVAKEVKGVDIDDADKEKLRLEQIIRNGISPRIPSIAIQPINLSNKREVFIIRIPQSWISPHRIIFSGHDKFYSRNSAGKYQLDVDELRIAFNLSETIREKLRDFRLNRISKLSANETPIPFLEDSKTVLHLIPFVSFSRPQSYEINKIFPDNQYPKIMMPISGREISWRYNFDGFITYQPTKNAISCSYAQVFRNGIIEAVDGIMLRLWMNKLSIPDYFEKKIIESSSEYLNLLKTLNVNPPIFLFIALLGVKDFTLQMDRRYKSFGKEENHKIDRDILFLPEIIIESYEVDMTAILKPCFDAVWNACGYERCFRYDENGDWKPEQ